MKHTARNIMISVGIAVGLIAAVASPAMAGTSLNHSEPLTRT
jgi:hypothetical protein